MQGQGRKETVVSEHVLSFLQQVLSSPVSATAVSATAVSALGLPPVTRKEQEFLLPHMAQRAGQAQILYIQFVISGSQQITYICMYVTYAYHITRQLRRYTVILCFLLCPEAVSGTSHIPTNIGKTLSAYVHHCFYLRCILRA